MKDFQKQKGEGTKKLEQARKWVGYCKVTFFWGWGGMAGDYQADFLASADQVIPE